MDNRLVTLITGASSGIGRDTAIRLSKSRRLVLQGRDAGRLEHTRLLCSNADIHNVWNADLADVSSIESGLVRAIKASEVGIAEFVHCAGTLDVLPLRAMTLRVMQNTLNVNFCAAVEIVRLLVTKRFNQAHFRNAVFVSSTASTFGARGFSAYSASKGALDAFMRSAAVELAPTVRLNSVLPGAVQSAMSEKVLEDESVAAAMLNEYPLGFGRASDISSVIEFLLSDGARWITGQQIVVDGGRTVNITPRRSSHT